MSEFVQQLVNALSVGASYALLAIGLAIVYNILRMINFAHGELLTLSGFTLYALQREGLPWWAMVPAAIVVSVIAAIAMERLAFRPVRGAGMTTTLVTSFALGIIIQQLLLIAFGSRPIAVSVPTSITRNILVGGVRIQLLHLISFGVTVVALMLLLVFFRRARLGIAMRAAAEDFVVTRLMGVRANLIITAAFALSGALAGLAGVLWVARRGTVEPFMGLGPVVNGFVAAVIGGLGSLPGAVVGGFLLGFVRVGLEAFLPAEPLRYIDAFTMTVVVTVLLLRPQGLFARRGEVT